MEPDSGWIAEGHVKVENPDAATRREYPWAVISENPTCVGGDIEKVGGVWVVTPDEGETTVTLEDPNPPADKAFYVIGVSAP